MKALAWITWMVLLSCTSAQFGGMPGQIGKEAKAVRSDMKYIRCEVCEHLAKQAYRQAGAFKKEVAQRKKKHERKVKEIELLEKIERLTQPLRDEGEWITFLDLVEDGDKLTVQEQKEPGKCGTECKTIQRTAELIIETVDTDIAEHLWKGDMSRSQFTKWLCKEATKSCRTKPPKLPSSRPPGPEFEVISPDELKMAKMMASMKEMGMGGQVFDRAQAKKFAENANPEDLENWDEEDHDDEDDSPFTQPPKATTTKADASSASSTPIVDSLSSGAEKAKENVGAAIESAKQAGKDLWSKAQNLLGGSEPSEAEL